ncbi:DeoR/GlpR family DNA-binding transcription regulator [Bosea sp. TWI1241]|uniref:DeoR/GlpR family DNA-binding transcription regulator n=1 Tax=Bosea sp. TWI1241 TaxID=3148904 RepID=UPI00320A912C
MDSLTPRQREIVALAREQGRVGVEELSARYGVSLQTIRKDLNQLCAMRAMSRVHGGAVVASSIENLAYEARRFIAPDEKAAIGRAAAALIPDGSSLFLNIGTTTEEVARALANHSGLLVITNNLHVATLLYPHPHIEVIVAGGAVRRSDGGVVGASAVELIRQFKVDYAVIGTSAIDEEGTLLDYDHQEVKVAQAIIGNARRRILVADASKLSRAAPVRIAHLRDLDVFVTDRLASERLRALCRAEEVAVVEALTAAHADDTVA